MANSTAMKIQLTTCQASSSTQTASATARTVAATTSSVRGRTRTSRAGARSIISASVLGGVSGGPAIVGGSAIVP